MAEANVTGLCHNLRIYARVHTFFPEHLINPEIISLHNERLVLQILIGETLPFVQRMSLIHQNPDTAGKQIDALISVSKRLLPLHQKPYLVIAFNQLLLRLEIRVFPPLQMNLRVLPFKFQNSGIGQGRQRPVTAHQAQGFLFPIKAPHLKCRLMHAFQKLLRLLIKIVSGSGRLKPLHRAFKEPDLKLFLQRVKSAA